MPVRQLSPWTTMSGLSSASSADEPSVQRIGGDRLGALLEGHGGVVAVLVAGLVREDAHRDLAELRGALDDADVAVVHDVGLDAQEHALSHVRLLS